MSERKIISEHAFVLNVEMKSLNALIKYLGNYRRWSLKEVRLPVLVGEMTAL